MYLTGPRIEELIARGEIVIDPFDRECVGPNSVDLHLHPEMRFYSRAILDMKDDLQTQPLVIPEDGLRLDPGLLYLGRTVEYTKFPRHVAQITGRSSVGRLGIHVHATAGLGDVGFEGTWTLEISVIQPVRIYPNVRICQIFVAEVSGDIRPYEGRYLNQVDATPSRFHKG